MGSGAYLRVDGTLGPDDPICWPQYYHPDLPHLPCIPTLDPDPQSPVYLFRRRLHREHVVFTNFWENGLRVATLSDDLVRDLESAVSNMADQERSFLSTHSQSHPRLKILMQSLRIAAKKLATSQEPVPELRMTFGIASRFCFESQGYIDYYSKYLPRLTSIDVPTVDANVVGVWTKDSTVCAKYLRMGIPVWFVRNAELVPNAYACFEEKMVKPREYFDRPRCPEECFRDDRSVLRSSPVFQERQIDTRVLMNEIDSLARKKVGEEHQ